MTKPEEEKVSCIIFEGFEVRTIASKGIFVKRLFNPEENGLFFHVSEFKNLKKIIELAEEEWSEE